MNILFTILLFIVAPDGSGVIVRHNKMFENPIECVAFFEYSVNKIPEEYEVYGGCYETRQI